MLSVYLLANGKTFKEAEMKIIPNGVKDVVRAMLKKIARMLHINKNSSIYEFFSKHIKHNSSYLKIDETKT